MITLPYRCEWTVVAGGGRRVRLLPILAAHYHWESVFISHMVCKIRQIPGDELFAEFVHKEPTGQR